MTLEPLNGIPLISEASKSKLYAFSLGSDRIRRLIMLCLISTRNYLKQVAMTACKETFSEIKQNKSLDFSVRKLVQGRVETKSLRHAHWGSFGTRFWETTILPLPWANINTYSSLRAKRRLRGGVNGQFPRHVKCRIGSSKRSLVK